MRAESINTPEVRVEEAGEAMLLMISSRVWDLLVIQGGGEGLSPGDVLERALRDYIETKGTSEAKTLLAQFGGQPGAQSVEGERR